MRKEKEIQPDVRTNEGTSSLAPEEALSSVSAQRANKGKEIKENSGQKAASIFFANPNQEQLRKALRNLNRLPDDDLRLAIDRSSRVEGNDLARVFLVTCLIELARRFIKKNDNASAESTFEKALAIRPTDSQLLLAMGDLQLELKDFVKAERYFSTLYERNPTNPRALCGLAIVAEQRDNLPLAHQFVADVLSKRPDDEKALKILSRLEVRQGHRNLQGNDFTDAEAHFQAALKANPDNIAAVNCLARLRDLEGRTVEAQKFYQQSLNMNPRDVRALTGLANINIRRGALDDAETYLFRALKVETDPFALSSMAAVQRHRGDTSQELSYLQRALEAGPKKTEVRVSILLALGNACKKLRKLPEAESYLLEALDIDENNPFVLKSLAEVKSRSNQQREAIQYLNRALKIDPGDTVALTALANIKVDLREPKEAIELLDTALKIDPDDPITLTSMGYAQLQAGNLAEAEKYLGQSLKVEPDSPGTECLLADVLRLTGRANPAYNIISRLVNNLPQDEDLKFSILCIFYLLRPDDLSWPVLERSSGIKKSSVASVTKAYQKQDMPFSKGLTRNKLWERPYRSAPIGRMALAGITNLEGYEWSSSPPSTKIRPGGKTG